MPMAESPSQFIYNINFLGINTLGKLIVLPTVTVQAKVLAVAVHTVPLPNGNGNV